MADITVLGGGTWGVALAVLLDSNGHNVTIWSALEKEINDLKETHTHKGLPGAVIPESISYTLDHAEAAAGKDLIIMAVASSFTRRTAKAFAPFIKDGQRIVTVAKGIEEETLMTQTQIVESEIPNAKLAVLSGPSHAEEVSRMLPTTVVVGSEDIKNAENIADLFMRDVFRVYTSTDVLGIELGGSIKNVIALAAGISDGLGYGDNAKAAIITRGIAEMSRLGTAMGGKEATFAGLTGIGDLIVTCDSMHSRNRRAGILIGQGKTMQEAMDEVQQIVEGVYSAKAAKALADKYQISMPIVEQVNQVLFENKPALQAFNDLMGRERKNEIAK
ncbi:MAG: NAD(P)-dependent glycerol-3-phosphate dehydrogenase [Lachnospiraceae bacterium]|nr:NAD(P)-dependent glycerol-3-phosphate dehydrogenase [Lachnospiraceae bacterium]